MAHEELKALYEIDKQHSDTPWKWWESYEFGKWVDRMTHPMWLEECEYRRKPDAPVWPVNHDAEDARRWKEAVFQSLITIDDREFRRNFLNILNPKKPTIIHGYTAEQWQTIIDGKFLCEFSDIEGFEDKAHIQTLKKIDPFRSGLCLTWKYCRPLRTKGVRQPWFGQPTCPLHEDAQVLVTLRNGTHWMRHAGGINWPAVTEFIEL